MASSRKTSKTSKTSGNNKKKSPKKSAAPSKARKARPAAKGSKPAAKAKASKKPAKKVKVAKKAAAPRKAAAKPKAKVAKAAAKPAAKAPKAAPQAAAPKPAPKGAPTYLGRADGMDAAVSLVLVDAKAAAGAWRIDNPEDLDAIEQAVDTFAKLGAGLESEKTKAVSVGKAGGVGFQLSVGKGVAHVYRAKDKLVLTEGFIDDPEGAAFLSYVASPPASGAAASQAFSVDSGLLAILQPGGSYEDLPGRVGQPISEGAAARIGSESPGLVVKLAPGQYRLLIEDETTGAFGQAARAVVSPA